MVDGTDNPQPLQPSVTFQIDRLELVSNTDLGHFGDFNFHFVAHILVDEDESILFFHKTKVILSLIFSRPFSLPLPHSSIILFSIWFFRCLACNIFHFSKIFYGALPSAILPFLPCHCYNFILLHIYFVYMSRFLIPIIGSFHLQCITVFCSIFIHSAIL